MFRFSMVYHVATAEDLEQIAKVSDEAKGFSTKAGSRLIACGDGDWGVERDALFEYLQEIGVDANGIIEAKKQSLSIQAKGYTVH